MNITRMQVNHISNPLGFDLGERPTFTWVVDDAAGTKAEASRVVVTCAGVTVADTGWAELDAKACALDVPLAPRARYEWRVSVRTDGGEEATSEPAWFETAKRDEPWEAQWITCDYDEPRHPVFRKDIPLEHKAIAAARLYVCGLGVYDATIDGERVSDEYLAPGTHAYDQWLQYQTYDVTELLARHEDDEGETDDYRPGHEARLAILLGHGWYSGRFGFVKTNRGYYGNDWRLIAELRVTYADGTEQVVGTDESWRVTRSNNLFSNIYDGEHIDGTLHSEQSVPADLLDAEAARQATVLLHDRLSLPVVAHETFVPEVIRTPAGETVLDLGQNIAGTFRMAVGPVPANTKLVLQFSELLQDGNFYRDNLRTAEARYECVLDGERSMHEPRLTFYGYRYVKVEGISVDDIESFEGVALYSDFDSERGRITTGHAKVNQLISNARWGMRGNFLDTATDCPQRDERMGWTGDANVFSKTALLLAAPYAFYRKYLYDMALEQRVHDGGVPLVVPSFGLDSAPAVWADATTFIPWNMYQADGDPAILAGHYEAMKSYVDWVLVQDGDSHALASSMQLGDWLALDSTDPSGRIGATDGGFIAYVYLWQSALIVSQTARLLGRDEDAVRYETIAAQTRTWIETEYLTATGRPAVTTMTGYVLCLSFGLGNKAWCAAQLCKMLKESGHLTTGFVGTPLLCPALSDAGLDREAYELLLREDYPSWLFAVNLGATTIWERWNSLDVDGHITGIEMNSMNHYSYGAIVQWIMNYAAGLQATEPGFAKARIAPRVSWALRSIDAELESAAGTWAISWECVDEQHLRVAVTVPFGTEAEVVLPHADEVAYEELGGHILTAGSYEVTYETTCPLRRVPNADWTLAQIVEAPDVAAVVRQFVDGFDYAMLTRDQSVTLRAAQAEGLGQNEKMTLEQLEACDAAMRTLAE